MSKIRREQLKEATLDCVDLHGVNGATISKISQHAGVSSGIVHHYFHNKTDLLEGSMASMEVRRLEAGILDNVTDFDVSMNPFQAGLGPFIDLEKEGYVGREALLEADQRVLLLGLKTADGVPAYQGEVFEDSTVVAHITAAAWSPTLECGIGYVRFREAADWIGRTLTVQTVDGGVTSCEIVALPFFDEGKKIPRGLV